MYINLLSIAPESSPILTAVPPFLLQWRTGGGRSHDRLVLEFRGTKWTFSVGSSASLTDLGRALWAILQSEDPLQITGPQQGHAVTHRGGELTWLFLLLLFFGYFLWFICFCRFYS